MYLNDVFKVKIKYALGYIRNAGILINNDSMSIAICLYDAKRILNRNLFLYPWVLNSTKNVGILHNVNGNKTINPKRVIINEIRQYIAH